MWKLLYRTRVEMLNTRCQFSILLYQCLMKISILAISCTCIKRYLTRYRNLIRYSTTSCLYPPVFESTRNQCFRYSRGYSRNAVTLPLEILVQKVSKATSKRTRVACGGQFDPICSDEIRETHTAEYVHKFPGEKSSKLVTRLNWPRIGIEAAGARGKVESRCQRLSVGSAV